MKLKSKCTISIITLKHWELFSLIEKQESIEATLINPDTKASLSIVKLTCEQILIEFLNPDKQIVINSLSFVSSNT